MNNNEIKVMFTDMYRSFDIHQAEQSFEWRMISKHWHPVLSDDPDFLFYSCFGKEHLKYDCIRIFYTPENIRPRFDRCDFAFSYDLPITERNYRLPIYRRWPEYKDLFRPRDPEKIVAQKRQFCGFMVSNPHAVERIDFFNRLSKYKKVDSGGGYLNNIGYRVERGSQNKLDWMRNYKFSITFENSSYPGYTTEKLMHALITDTIPIYWGNPLASLDFNPKAFINCHDYPSFDDVVELVREIDQNDSLYMEYLSQPYLTDNMETEFCKEENIVARYDEILSSRKFYISPGIKRLQKPLYSWYRLETTARKLFRKVRAYSKQAVAMIKTKTFRKRNIG
jgi:hypothetical protein